jgi:hypothetical protein
VQAAVVTPVDARGHKVKRDALCMQHVKVCKHVREVVKVSLNTKQLAGYFNAKHPNNAKEAQPTRTRTHTLLHTSPRMLLPLLLL